MGNSDFTSAKKTLRKEIDDFDSQEVNYFMENFVDAFSLTLDELQS